MDVSSILSIIQQHWLEVLIFLSIVFILRNLKWIIIAGLIFVVLLHFGYLDSIKELILSYFNSFNSHVIPFEFLQNLINSTNSTNIPSIKNITNFSGG